MARRFLMDDWRFFPRLAAMIAYSPSAANKSFSLRIRGVAEPTLPLFFYPIVEHDDLLAQVADDLDVRFVGRMDQIRGQVGFVLERHNEYVREAFGLPFFADVGAVLEADDRIDLLRQGGEGVDD